MEHHIKNTGIGYLVGAGEFSSAGFRPNEGDLIIAVDGGYTTLQELGIIPDIAVGDFDSLGFVPKDVPVHKHPEMKDDTDMMLAAQQAITAGCRRLYIFGGTGGRLDHTMANMQLLLHIAETDAEGFLFGKDYTITSIKNGMLRFEEGYEGTISVFSATQCARGVYLRGLKYPLTDALLLNSVPLGVSNEFTGTAAEIEVHDGTLLVIWYGNDEKPLPQR